MKKLHYISLKLILSFAILYLLSYSGPVHAQTGTKDEIIYFETFSGNSFPAGWKSYSTSNSKWEVIQGVNSREAQPTSSSALNIAKNGTQIELATNIWAFTNGINMFPDVVYTITFYHRNNGAGTLKLNVVVNNVQDHDKAVNIAPETNFTTDKRDWEPSEFVSTFTIKGEGLNYIGFGVKELAGGANFFIDEIRITASSGPMQGTYNVGFDGYFLKIQTALAHLNRRGTSGPVTFKLIDETYTIAPGNNLLITPLGGSLGVHPITLKAATPGLTTITGSPAKDGLFYINAVNNVHLEGLKINNSSLKSPWGIAFDKSSNSSVNGCTITAGSASSESGARGISIKDGSNVLLKNNMIHSIQAKGITVLSGFTDAELANPYGIVIEGGSNHKVYNNSVNMTGTQPVPGNISAALAVSAGATGLDVRNNIFANTRTSAGITNYAVYSLATKTAFTHLNYNLYYAAAATLGNHVGYMAGSGNATSLSSWKAATAKDASSMFAQPAFISTTDLGINLASPNSWFTNDTGVQLTAVTHDKNGNSRSTSVLTGGVDLGAIEFTPTVPAPDMVVTGQRAPGQRQAFTFAGREMAAITWSPTSTTIPANMVIKYKPGVADATFNGKRMNSSMEIINSTGTYTYDLEMYYDDALLGALEESEYDFTPAVKTADKGWISHRAVNYDFILNKLTKGGISSAVSLIGADKSQSLEYFNKSSNLTSLSSWGPNSDGSGVNPKDLTKVGRIYHIKNYQSGTVLELNSNLDITGTGSKIILGDGSTPVTLKVHNGGTITGAKIDMPVNATLLIDGPTWPILGDMDQTSTIMLGPNAPMDIPVDREFPNVVLLSGKKIKLNKNLKITKKLELRDGSKMELGDYSLNIDYDGQVVSNNAGSYIIPNGKGKLKQGIRAGQEVSLPVGTATTYNPVKIMLAAGSQNDIFSVGLLSGVYGTYDTNDVPTGTALSTHNVNKTWVVSEEVKGGSNITLTLTWAQEEAQTKFDATKSYVQHYENGAWDEYQVGAATTSTLTGADGTTKTYYSISRPGITSFSPMAVRTPESITPLPVELVEFTAGVTRNNSVKLTWATASEKNNNYFVLERSIDGKNFTELSSVKGAGTSNTRRNYTYTDLNPLTGISYYRLRQVDFDGTFEFSSVRSVNLKATQKFTLSVYPNPSQGSEVNLLAHGMPQGEMATLLVTDPAGKTIVQAQLKENKTILPTAHLKPGVYIIRLVSSSGSHTQKLMVQ